MRSHDIRVFGLAGSVGLADRVASQLGVDRAAHEERDFVDGEHKARPLASVRGRDVYVVCSLYGDADHTVNDKLVRLLFFVGALRQNGAGRVTAVVPYLCYTRKDRQTQDRDPVNTRYVAQLFEAAGVDAVVTMDVHNLAAYQNAFRCAAWHVSARGMFADHLLARLDDGARVAVVSPDAGGQKRAESLREVFRERLQTDDVSLVFMEKKRAEGEVTGDAVVGDIDGRVAVILDDMVASGGTLARSARACRAGGAVRTVAAVTHGLFVGDAAEAVSDDALAGLLVTDTIPPFRLPQDVLDAHVTVLDTAPLLAEVVRRLHEDEPLSELPW